MLLQLKNVSFGYKEGESIINDIDFEIKKGELVVIEGKSGSGKSTFLNIAGLIAFPQKGRVTFMNQDVNKKTFQLRRNIGHIFQSHMLWKDLSVKENVAMPLILQGNRRKYAYEVAEKWLCDVGLEKHIQSSVTQISGGEQQRVGLARAFAHQPDLILADEPTGNLDDETGDRIMHMCLNIAKKTNTSIICVTHNKKWNHMFNSEYHFKDGNLYNIRRNDV